MAAFLPHGMSVFEAPWPIVTAVSHANMILGWYENYTKDELPPEAIWLDDELLVSHFSELRRAREAGQSGGGSSQMYSIPAGPGVQNGFTEGLRNG